ASGASGRSQSAIRGTLPLEHMAWEVWRNAMPVERAPRTVRSLRARDQSRSGAMYYRASRTPLQHLAHTVGNHCVLAERHAHVRLVEAERTKHRKRIGRRLAGELVSSGDDAASTRFDQAERDRVEAKLCDAVFFEGLQPFEHDVRTEALHADWA